jgi:6-phospho-3-hexuloisomerase
MDKNKILNRFKSTLEEIVNKIIENKENADFNSIFNLLDLILNTYKNGNRIFLYGAGRSGFMGRSFAQRLMHLGIDTCFISDAITHQYTKSDLLILISGSGETPSSVAIAERAKLIGGKIVLLTGNEESSIGRIADCTLIIRGKSKDRAISIKTLAPYTSLFDISTLAILDSIGGTLMELLDVTEKDIDLRHATIE